MVLSQKDLKVSDTYNKILAIKFEKKKNKKANVVYNFSSGNFPSLSD